MFCTIVIVIVIANTNTIIIIFRYNISSTFTIFIVITVTTSDDVIYHLITVHFTATVTVVVYLSRLYAVSI